MKPKHRLDEILVERGFFPDEHAARAAVLAGEVVVGEHRETSAGKRLPPDVELRVKGGHAFASRGGAKLEGALRAFPISIQGASCVDLGASTGGFTDCLLQHGAAHVAAVDVGYGQFDWKLRNDSRVSLYERTNVHGLRPETVGGPFGIAVADLSFIRLERVMDDVVVLLDAGGIFISLIKPQFEVAKEDVGEGGIVRSPALHEQAIRQVCQASGEHHLAVRGLTYSPITGPKGNVEFLYWATKEAAEGQLGSSIDERLVHEVVQQAHANFGGVQ